MTAREKTRLTDGLRSAGWNENEIGGFIMFVRSGDEKFLPKQKNASNKDNTAQTK